MTDETHIIDAEQERDIVLDWLLAQGGEDAEDTYRLYRESAFFKTTVDEVMQVIVPALVTGLAAQARNVDRLQAQLLAQMMAPPDPHAVAAMRAAIQQAGFGD